MMSLFLMVIPVLIWNAGVLWSRRPGADPWDGSFALLALPLIVIGAFVAAMGALVLPVYAYIQKMRGRELAYTIGLIVLFGIYVVVMYFNFSESPDGNHFRILLGRP